MERLSLAQICSWRMMNSKITVVLRLFYFLLEIETADEGTKDRLVRWWIVYQYVWIRKSSRFSDTNFHIENKQLGLIKSIFISMTRVLKKGFLEGSWRSSRNIYKSLVFHYFCLTSSISLSIAFIRFTDREELFTKTNAPHWLFPLNDETRQTSLVLDSILVTGIGKYL